MPLRQRKSSSKCLEAMFKGTKSVAVVTDQGTVQNSTSSKVQRRQLSSTPLDHNANELHCLPVGNFGILFC